MANAAAAARAAARERLAADLQKLGAALRLEARPGLAPEAQELASSWDLRSQALLDAVDSTEDGLEVPAATAAAELLQPLLGGGAAAHPHLFAQGAQAATSAAQCCSVEALPFFAVPVASSLLALFFNEQLDSQTRSAAAEALLVLVVGDCAASLLAAPAAEGAVEALIAAAKCEGDPQQDSACSVLAALAADDIATAERAASPEAGLLPIAVERIRSVAADGPQGLVGRSFFGPLRLLWVLAGSAAPDAVRTRARAAPGVAGAAADLLTALAAAQGTAEVAAQQAACQHEDLEEQSLSVLSGLMRAAPSTYAQAFDALTRSGALPRVLALLRSPSKAVRSAATRCIAAVAAEDPGRDAVFKAPRAVSELAAALRRAYADGEHPILTQFYAADALLGLMSHSEGRRVAEALARAAAAEGSAGSLLGALAGLIAASVDEAVVDIEGRHIMCAASAGVLAQMTSAACAMAAERALRRAPRLAEACVGALQYWAAAASDQQNLGVVLSLLFVVGTLAGFEPAQATTILGFTPPPAATPDTAAARAALRGAPGLRPALQRFLDWAPGAMQGGFEVLIAKWLLKLPEVKAPAVPAAAPTPAAAAAAASAAPTAADPASAAPFGAPVQAPATAAAVPPPAAAGSPSAAAQPLVPEAGSSSSSSSSSSRADGGGPSSSGGGGGGDGGGSSSAGGSDSGAEAAAWPKACASCGKSATAEVPLLRCVGCKAQYYCGDACALSHWPSHRAACKAARRAAAQRP
ncbi:hypothetical protein Rsub_10327 [Raphidocelis subcapitata]|uniref:MYND-type domain-containing protein n=1 Tax=Raphidocelis subcapitata TaxID=307507 RepID=A0A2V0PGU6_9CHLO|nr:hypothetical protein Rsub_10327 [Raphidocelis subcapitata]|eukprot:GBF97140.1 hypothetical protein Rsub_10327 [Raphidocelis subcapitata]